MDVTSPLSPTGFRILSSAEIEELCEAIRSRDPWFEYYLKFALLTGMRRGETLALTWHDIDLWLNREIIVPDPRQPYYRDPKCRRIPIDEILLGILLDLRSPSRWVFQKTGRRMLGSTVSLFFRELSVQTGITVTSERIRMTYAMNRYLQLRPRSRKDWEILQENLGHRDVSTTRNYFQRHFSELPSQSVN